MSRYTRIKMSRYTRIKIHGSPKDCCYGRGGQSISTITTAFRPLGEVPLLYLPLRALKRLEFAVHIAKP